MVLVGVGAFVVAGGMIASDDATSFSSSLLLLLFDCRLPEGSPDVALQLRGSEGPPEGRTALRPDSCLDVDGAGIGGIVE